MITFKLAYTMGEHASTYYAGLSASDYTRSGGPGALSESAQSTAHAMGAAGTTSIEVRDSDRLALKGHTNRCLKFPSEHECK